MARANVVLPAPRSPDRGHQIAGLERSCDVGDEAHRGLLVGERHGEARSAGAEGKHCGPSSTANLSRYPGAPQRTGIHGLSRNCIGNASIMDSRIGRSARSGATSAALFNNLLEHFPVKRGPVRRRKGDQCEEPRTAPLLGRRPLRLDVLIERELADDRGALADHRVERHGAAVQLDEGAHDRQPEAGAAVDASPANATRTS